MARSVFVSVVVAAATVQTSLAQTTVGQKAAEVDRLIQQHYLDRATGTLYTTLGADGKPEFRAQEKAPRALESSPIYTALYLDTALARQDTDLARQLLHGLIRLARASGIPGFLARGIYPDGKRYYGDPSTLDYAAFHYAMWRYYNGALAAPAEKAEIRAVVAASLDRLEEHRFVILNERGDPTSLHELASPGPMAGEHLLAILLSGWQITGDPHWRNVYSRRLPSRLNHLRYYGWAQPTPHPTTCPQNAWTMHRGLLSFTILLQLEEDEERRTAFRSGAARAVASAVQEAAAFRDYLMWRKSHPEAERLLKEPVAHPIMIPLFPAHDVVNFWHNRGPQRQFETAPEHRKVWYAAESFAAAMLVPDAAGGADSASMGRELLETVDFSEFRDVRPLVAAVCGYARAKQSGVLK
jgi:hypothetical protein